MKVEVKVLKEKNKISIRWKEEVYICLKNNLKESSQRKSTRKDSTERRESLEAEV